MAACTFILNLSHALDRRAWDSNNNNLCSIDLEQTHPKKSRQENNN
jgi:hypothetical protein